MTASLSIAGLHNHPSQGAWAAGPRALLAWAASLGFGGLHLDATAPGMRPRELDRSARRDLAATLRRNSLGFTGLELRIPPAHFTDPAHADRAMDALAATLSLASELAGLIDGGLPIVSVTLPDGLSDENLTAIAARADGVGAVAERFTNPPKEAGGPSHPGLVPGLDTARIVLRGESPEQSFAAAASSLRSLRLNDADDTGRRPLGRGTVDLAAMLALHATLTPTIPIVTDLRGLDDPQAAAVAARHALIRG